jgi:polyhydroxybutyrate depolymerase
MTTTSGTTGSGNTGGTRGDGGVRDASATTGTTGGTTAGATGTTGDGGGSTCPGTLKAGDSNQTITSSGMSRKFIVHLPTNYSGSSPLPVVFDFHPLGGTGASQEQASGWGKKCDSVGCIAVFPDSGPSDNSWNVGYCCSNSQSQKVDDVQFTRDMIKWLEANTCVDPKRIYASGCSNGGGMSYMLACNAADVIAAVAPVDFRCITGAEPASASSLTATNNTACTCKLPRPISVMAFDEGQDMSIVPYNGGKTVVPAKCPPGGSCAAFNFPSASVNFGTWANFDMCTGSPTADPNNSICQTYTSCSDNTEVALCTAPSSNHCGSYGLAKIVDTAWNMFQKESLH